jgi:DNA-binding MarR family transcriptional regulator
LTAQPARYHAATMTSPSSLTTVRPSAERAEARIDPRLAPWIAFIRAHAAVSRTLAAELEAEQSLSLADYDALVQLTIADGRKLRMNELADRLLLTRSGVSRLVDRLVDDGYVKRLACPTDARGAFAVLTEAGLRRLRDASPTHLRGVDEHFLAAIPEGDREAFVRVLEGIVAAAGGDSREPA